MYEIQTLTMRNGYKNLWLNDDDNPRVFNTHAEEKGELQYTLCRYDAPDYECHCILETNSLADIRKALKGAAQ